MLRQERRTGRRAASLPWVYVLLAFGIATTGACGGAPEHIVFHATENPELLSAWGVLAVDDGQLLLNDGVLPFDLNTALFTDYAHKLRTVWMPEGTSARWDGSEHLEYPVGTILTKTFYYPVEGGASSSIRVLRTGTDTQPEFANGLDLEKVKVLETRLLAHRVDGWVALPYVWNEEETDARLEIAGDALRLEFASEDGGSEPFPYIVPDMNQCAGCHASDHTAGAVLPLGPKLRHLNKSYQYVDHEANQLERWTDVGYLSDAPSPAPRAAAWDDPATGTLEERARAYLDINCGHCHNPEGPADTSGLFLDYATTELRRLGMCKPPVAAGRGSGDLNHSIEPGLPEESIMIYRLASTDPGEAMPELGRSTTHLEGIELLSEWIREFAPGC